MTDHDSMCSQVVCSGMLSIGADTVNRTSHKTSPWLSLGAAVSLLDMFLVLSLGLVCSHWLWSLSVTSILAQTPHVHC